MAVVRVLRHFNLDTFRIDSLVDHGDVVASTSTVFVVETGAERVRFTGTGFSYDNHGFLTSGTIKGITYSKNSSTVFTINQLSVSVNAVEGYIKTKNEKALIANLLKGHDTFYLDHNGSPAGGYEFTGRGHAGNDKMLGSRFDDKFLGLSGNDTLLGGSGNDYLSGGIGLDKLAGDAGNDQLFGNENGDLLAGGVGSDSLIGGDGNDTLAGGANDDILVGGTGNDRFVFVAVDDSQPFARDRITDLQLKTSLIDGDYDIIDLSQIDSDPGNAGDQAFSMTQGSGLIDPGDAQIRWDVFTGEVTLELNTDTDSDPEVSIRLTSLETLDPAAIQQAIDDMYGFRDYMFVL